MLLELQGVAGEGEGHVGWHLRFAQATDVDERHIDAELTQPTPHEIGFDPFRVERGEKVDGHRSG